MTARVVADPPRDPIDGWPVDKPHPAGPNGPRAELDRLTGPLPDAVDAVVRWGEELAEQPEPPGTDLLEPTRRAAKRAAELVTGRGGDPR